MDLRDFYFRQRVTQAELDEAIGTLPQLAMWRIVSDILGYGFFAGPTMSQAAVPDLTVDLSTLLGYDQMGRRLYIPPTSAPYNVNCAVDENAAPTAVVGAPNEKWISLFVEFDRTQADPRTDGNGTLVYWENNEWFKINVVQAAEQPLGTGLLPAVRADQVLLGDIHLVFGQTTILDGYPVGDIDQSRREDFTLTAFLHGATHVETGGDPVPNATAGVGGIMSATDKTKMDTITWTPVGISDELNLLGRGFQAANINAAAATFQLVTAEMVAHGSPAGGDPTTKGVVTVAPYNRVILLDVNRDSFVDVDGDKIYALLTEAAGVWTLSYKVFKAGAEGPYDMTPHAGAVVLWYPQEVYSLDSFPTLDPAYSIQSDQVAGEVPDATTSVKGKVLLCPDGVSTGSTVCQGDDSRLTGVGALALIRKMASKPSLVFMREDSVLFSDYRLHQFHGLAHGKYPSGDPDYYFEFDPSHADYPLLVRFTGSPNASAGLVAGAYPNDYWGSDSSRPAPGGAGTQWLYVYLLGRAGSSPKYTLVFSDQGPSTGPDLSDSSGTGGYDFPSDGWEYWRFIGCVLNLGTGAPPWEMAQLRKIGNHVSYELERRIQQYTAADTGVTSVSLAPFMPPTSVRAELGLRVQAQNTIITMGVRARQAVAQLKLQEPAGVAPFPFFFDWQLYVIQEEGSNAVTAHEHARGWVDTDASNFVELQETHGVGSGEEGELSIYGWEEFEDRENNDFSF